MNQEKIGGRHMSEQFNLDKPPKIGRYQETNFDPKTNARLSLEKLLDSLRSSGDKSQINEDLFGELSERASPDS